MTDETGYTDASEQAQNLREMADKIEDPLYQTGLNEGADRTTKALYGKLLGSLDARGQDAFERAVDADPEITWDGLFEVYARLKGGAAQPTKSGTPQQGAPRQATANIKTTYDLDRAFNSGQLSAAEYKDWMINKFHYKNDGYGFSRGPHTKQRL